MARETPYEAHTDRYESWFEAHQAAYESELAALRSLRPNPGRGLEIGVGTGRFAAPLGYAVGLDPAIAMLARARERGVTAVRGVAEALPFREESFDTALLVTTVCFVDDLLATFREARRVLDSDGALVLGYIDRESPVGRRYLERQDQNPFYRDASFVSTDEILSTLGTAGYEVEATRQTIYSWPDEMTAPDPVDEGDGDGSFVGIRAVPRP
jgi:SAM-dependent methyltransferase